MIVSSFWRNIIAAFIITADVLLLGFFTFYIVSEADVKKEPAVANSSKPISDKDSDEKIDFIKLLSTDASLVALGISLLSFLFNQPVAASIKIPLRKYSLDSGQRKLNIFFFNFGKLPGRIKVKSVVTGNAEAEKLYAGNDWQPVEPMKDYTVCIVLPDDPVPEAIIVNYETSIEGKVSKTKRHKIALLRREKK